MILRIFREIITIKILIWAFDPHSPLLTIINHARFNFKQKNFELKDYFFNAEDIHKKISQPAFALHKSNTK